MSISKPKMEKILISSCLLGEKVRYHGGNALLTHPLLNKWKLEERLIPFCPEVSAGMPTPRPPSEIIGHNGGVGVLQGVSKIMNKDGVDVTQTYKRGAEMALSLARQNKIRIAILKDGSPSCGSTMIYDGSFSSKKISGSGVTAALFRSEGIAVFSENEIEKAEKFLEQLLKEDRVK